MLKVSSTNPMGIAPLKDPNRPVCIQSGCNQPSHVIRINKKSKTEWYAQYRKNCELHHKATYKPNLKKNLEKSGYKEKEVFIKEETEKYNISPYGPNAKDSISFKDSGSFFE
tara:strand:+ start:350 stop:685 length:336 start_codon:yes stop_codon:yes gene_type:complete